MNVRKKPGQRFKNHLFDVTALGGYTVRDSTSLVRSSKNSCSLLLSFFPNSGLPHLRRTRTFSVICRYCGTILNQPVISSSAAPISPGMQPAIRIIAPSCRSFKSSRSLSSFSRAALSRSRSSFSSASFCFLVSAQRAKYACKAIVITEPSAPFEIKSNTEFKTGTDTEAITLGTL